MVRPNVSPPTPQRTPKKNVQKRVLRPESRRISSVWGRIASENAHGATIQLKTPPTSQYVSQDQPRTLL
jgi:hypothetical protein